MNCATARGIFLVTFLLLAIGVVMVTSTSSTVSRERYGGELELLRNHLVFLAVGLVAFVAAFACPPRVLERLAVWVLVAGFLLCLAVFTPLGREAGGAKRWLRAGGVGFQPMEVLKLGLVIYAARFLSRRPGRAAEFTRGLLPIGAVTLAAMFLILLQPDYSSALVIGAIVLVMVFVAGARLRHLALVVAPAVPAALLLALMEPYRVKRLIAFIRPWETAGGEGYQTIQSMVGVASGGLFGLGLGCSRQKLLYLPESHTDFIFSIVGEELGLVGAGCVVVLFACLVCFGMRASRAASSPFSSLLAAGVVAMIGTQAALHMGVVVGLVPPTGVTLPFLSYGGSSMVFSLAACGLLLRVAAQPASSGASATAVAERPAREARLRLRQTRFDRGWAA